MNSIYIGAIPLGLAHPPVIFPDIGTFFDSDINLAKKMIRLENNFILDLEI